ncbi:hypothetical protein [Methylovulum psychrotolerans]|uniref:Lipoprotein n=1 Tax=Methylovulum psychrotolerans TaxID=1704499 RepID=A0A2S5CGL8_9GAMM|nr:hypothetical protein [Methylovulum psychrotolerans]POZ49882.1 hypothetical protein AADEFJLK_04328 [Methylovulum psychrotolerans]
MNRLVVLASSFILIGLAGCANMKYKGWKKVKILSDTYKQPCQLVGREATPERGSLVFAQKHAILANGNTVSFKSIDGIQTAFYFYCAPGLPPYTKRDYKVTMLTNKLYPEATLLDFEKVSAKCKYEAHAATIDTSRRPSERVYVPTNNLSFSLSQQQASATDRFNESSHELHLRVEQSNLYSECLAAQGFAYTSSDAEADYLLVEKTCPDYKEKACFIPGGK